jgi:hypothetical protein
MTRGPVDCHSTDIERKYQMLHKESHELAGKEAKIRADAEHAQVPGFGGATIRIEDWWDKVSGGSWMNATGNPAALVYAMRSSFQKYHVPIDDEVVYGKIGAFGHLVHVSELET